jgi:hypothetical protein
VRGIVAAFALVAAGCATATMDQAVADRESGVTEVYPLPPARALEVADRVLWDATREAPEADPERGLLRVRGGMGDDETLIVVWVAARDRPGECAVTVVARRVGSLQMVRVLTEEQFHERFRAEAGLRRAKPPE